MQQRRKFSEEFKREAAGLTGLPDGNISQIAQDLGIGSNLLAMAPGVGVRRQEAVSRRSL